MKKVFLISIILIIKLFPQAEYVPSDNPVYDFLERMESQEILSNYNSFEIPKSRKEVAEYLKDVVVNQNKLDESDKNELSDLQVEFEYDLNGTLSNSQAVIGNQKYDLFSQQEKYFFLFNEPEKFNLFINLVSEGSLIFDNELEPKKNLSTSLGYIGGEIRGTILNKFGFYLKGINGSIFGNKDAALLRNDLKYNFKLNEKPEETFFDETEGYITADFDVIKFKLGRDRLNVGYGPVNSFIDNNSPKFDYIGLNIKYKFFSFSYFHGKLLGPLTSSFDSTAGQENFVEEKYIAYHRLGFNISKDVDFGLGEFIIYGGRPIDLSYLNPFGLYKSVEHQNRDRDNSLLFFDFNNNSIKGIKLYTAFLIDDITFSKLGSGWYGNQFLLNAGLYSSSFYKIIPVDFRIEYFRIEPYVFSHRFLRNNFTNLGYKLGPDLQPNSELLYAQVKYRFNYRLNLTADFSYTRHGANPLAADGTVIENVGGDISLGHRVFDSEKVHFLDGFLEYERMMSAAINYEPINQIIFYFNLRYVNRSLQYSNKESMETFFNLSIKI